MSIKTAIMTRRRWDALDEDIKKAIKKVLIVKDQVRGNYLSNIESELRLRGEHELARQLLDSAGENHEHHI